MRAVVVTDPGGLDRVARRKRLLLELLEDHRRAQERPGQLRQVGVCEQRAVGRALDDLLRGRRSLGDARRAVPARRAALHPREHRAPLHLGRPQIEVGRAEERVRAGQQEDRARLAAESARHELLAKGRHIWKSGACAVELTSRIAPSFPALQQFAAYEKVAVSPRPP